MKNKMTKEEFRNNEINASLLAMLVVTVGPIVSFLAFQDIGLFVTQQEKGLLAIILLVLYHTITIICFMKYWNRLKKEFESSN